MKKNQFLSDYFENFVHVVFKILAIFEFPNDHSGQMAKKLAIFVSVNVCYTLVKFEPDWMSPQESTKNGRKGAHGLN